MYLIVYSFLLFICCSLENIFAFEMEVFVMYGMRALETLLGESGEIKMTSYVQNKNRME